MGKKNVPRNWAGITQIERLEILATRDGKYHIILFHIINQGF